MMKRRGRRMGRSKREKKQREAGEKIRRER
jgi:hypothetical protein